MLCMAATAFLASTMATAAPKAKPTPVPQPRVELMWHWRIAAPMGGFISKGGNQWARRKGAVSEALAIGLQYGGSAPHCFYGGEVAGPIIEGSTHGRKTTSYSCLTGGVLEEHYDVRIEPDEDTRPGLPSGFELLYTAQPLALSRWARLSEENRDRLAPGRVIMRQLVATLAPPVGEPESAEDAPLPPSR